MVAGCGGRAAGEGVVLQREGAGEVREGEKKLGGGGVVVWWMYAYLGREEKGTAYLSIHVSGVCCQEHGGQTDQIKI